MMNHSNYIEPTNQLLIKLNTQKLYDSFSFKTAQIMYEADNNQLCHRNPEAVRNQSGLL